MKRLLLSIVTLIMLIGLNACGKNEDKWDGVEIDRELYSQKIIDVYKRFGYEDIDISNFILSHEGTDYLVEAEGMEILTTIYWDNKLIDVTYYKNNKDYFGEEFDKELIVSLINSVAEYPITEKLIDDSMKECKHLARSYKQNSGQCEFGTVEISFKPFDISKKFGYEGEGGAQYYYPKEIGEKSEYYKNGYRYYEQYKIGTYIKPLKE